MISAFRYIFLYLYISAVKSTVYYYSKQEFTHGDAEQHCTDMANYHPICTRTLIQNMTEIATKLTLNQTAWVNGIIYHWGCDTRGFCPEFIVELAHINEQKYMESVCDVDGVLYTSYSCVGESSIGNIGTYSDLNALLNETRFQRNVKYRINDFLVQLARECRVVTKDPTNNLRFSLENCDQRHAVICHKADDPKKMVTTVMVKNEYLTLISTQRSTTSQILQSTSLNKVDRNTQPFPQPQMPRTTSKVINENIASIGKTDESTNETNATDPEIFPEESPSFVKLSYTTIGASVAIIVLIIIVIVLSIVICLKTRADNDTNRTEAVVNEYTTWFTSQDRLDEVPAQSSTAEEPHYMTLPGDPVYLTLNPDNERESKAENEYTWLGGNISNPGDRDATNLFEVVNASVEIRQSNRNQTRYS